MCQNDADLVSVDAVIGFLLNDPNAQTETNYFATQINMMYKKGSSPVNPEAILQQDEISDNKPSKAAIIAKTRFHKKKKKNFCRKQ